MKEKLTALQIAVFAVNCTNSEEDIENVRKAIEEYRPSPVAINREEIAKILRDNITFSPQINDYIIHGAIDKLIEYFKNQSQPIEKEQTNLFEIKKQVALDMGFDLNTDVYKIHFSDYTDEIAKRFASWKLKEQEQEIERLKEEIINRRKFIALQKETFDSRIKELEAQLKEVKEIARDKINISAINESSRSKLDRIYKLIESSPTEQPEAQKDCNHEALTDTGVGYNYCPICKGSWKQQNQPQPEKDWRNDLSRKLNKLPTEEPQEE